MLDFNVAMKKDKSIGLFTNKKNHSINLKCRLSEKLLFLAKYKADYL